MNEANTIIQSMAETFAVAETAIKIFDKMRRWNFIERFIDRARRLGNDKSVASGDYSTAASSGDYSKAASSGDYSTAAYMKTMLVIGNIHEQKDGE